MTKKVNSFANELLSMRRKYNALLEKDRSRLTTLQPAVSWLSLKVPRELLTQASQPLAQGIVAYQKKAEPEGTIGQKKKKAPSKKQKQVRQQENRAPSAKFVRKPCDCQALVHALVNNCLKCGKIICAREGEGPCMFCGANEAALQSDDIQKATAHRDKLIGYDTDARINKVYGEASLVLLLRESDSHASDR